MHWRFTLLAIFAVIALSDGAPISANDNDLPVVDLGYERHRAISLDQVSGIYNFSNIRYAAAPVGGLRWQPPARPKQDTSQIQTGYVGRVCPQADPLWGIDIAPVFVEDYLSGIPYNGSTDVASYGYTPSPPDPRTTEDCLFLDVLTPRKALTRKHSRMKVPVLVWIFGGGYVMGDKTAFDGSGLIRRSMADGGEGLIFVAVNYRLGAFGWLAGQDVKANGVANAGLYDQRFALEWVNRNIHLFGGDPKRITVMGESSGGGSVMHQITAYGGQRGPAPFQRAILQSPGFVPVRYQAQQDAILQKFLQILRVSNIEEARGLPSDRLISANAYQVATQPFYGTFVYGPVVDGSFVPSLPGELLWKGELYRQVEVMVGHNANEGLDFTSPNDTTETGLIENLQGVFPGIMSSVVGFILNVLYPPIYNGAYGYTNSVERASLVNADYGFQCNTDYINRGFGNHTYSYMFSVPPALHGQDVPYTFYDGSSPTTVNVTLALVLQDYIVTFVESGTPQSSLGPSFPQHGEEAQLVNLNKSNITIIRDPTANPRCRWWQTAPY